MRTIRTKVYQFSELSEQAKENAIEQVRGSYYEYNDFAEWAIDDDYLFEPKHDELVRLFGSNFYEEMNKGKKYTDPPMIGNKRKKIYFDCDRGSYLDCAEAMEINNDSYFLKWLGIPAEMEVSYEIFTPSGRNRDTTIEILSIPDMTPEIEAAISKAEQKFNDHIQDCLNCIRESIEYYFTDEAIIEDISSNQYEFKADGTRF
jgi:hypothetical protein